MGTTTEACEKINEANRLLDEADDLLQGKSPQDVLTDITLVVDRSGSMAAVRDDAIGGMQEFVRKQQEAPGRATLTVHQFDTDHDVVMDGRCLTEVRAEDLRLEPRGGTALLDAIGMAIAAAEQRVLSRKPDLVVFVVVTDGGENSSREFKREFIRSKIEQCRKSRDWQFVFIGSDLQGVQDARSVAIDAANVLRCGPGGQSVRAAYAATADNVTQFRSVGNSAALSYTGDQRAIADGE